MQPDAASEQSGSKAHLARKMAREASSSLALARSLRSAASATSWCPARVLPLRNAVLAACIVALYSSHSRCAGPRISCRVDVIGHGFATGSTKTCGRTCVKTAS